jgi:hypothetical protein
MVSPTNGRRLNGDIYMRLSSATRIGVASAIVVLTPAIASAQGTGRSAPSTPASSSIDVTPYAGYMVFGDLMSGPLNSSISNSPAPILGVQAGIRIAPNISFIANVAGSNSEIKAGLPIIGGVTLAETSTILYDVGLELRMEQAEAYGYRFVPFAQAGVGGMHYDITEAGLSATANNLAGNIGVGADVGLGAGMSLRLMARDYIGKFNFSDVLSFDVSSGTTNNYALSAGIRLSF